MTTKAKLSKAMTIRQFDTGYWYATELKEFAVTLGVPSANKLRKDELEEAIKRFLSMGEVQIPTKRALSRRGPPDVEKGLTCDLPVGNYTNDKETKEFLVREAKKLVPSLRERSGARYRLNRWREQQRTRGIAISYGDVVRKYVALNQSSEPFERVPHGRYINFVADFLRGETGATRQDAIAAWERLKKMDIPKDYKSWRRARPR